MTAPHDNTPADLRVEVAREYAHADPPGRHPHLTGILLMCLGLVLINTSDAIGKLMTEELPIFAVRGLAMDADPAVRRAAYDAELGAWRSNAIRCSNCP